MRKSRKWPARTITKRNPGVPWSTQESSRIAEFEQLFCFRLAVQFRAHRQGIVWIDGAIAFFDMLNHAVLIDDNVGALSPLIGLILLVVAFENAVGCQHFLVHVT